MNETEHMVTDDNNVHVVDCTDSGAENLDTMLELMEEHNAMKDEIQELCSQFVSDVEQRIKQLDVQYLTGLKIFSSVYI